MESLELFITCAKSQEDLLAEELNQLGISEYKIKVGGIAAQVSQEDALRICLWSRVASRVLYKLLEFTATDEDTLYKTLLQFPWTDHMAVHNTFAVSCTLSKSEFTHNKYLALKTKDAIVDYFMDQQGSRPSVETNQPDIQINLYITGTSAQLYLDLSGESLHKRGYRNTGERAPLKENLAAAILYRCKWPQRAQNGESFVDPMCGSGTLLIEAAYMASNTAPALYRGYFGFTHWKNFDQALWQKVWREAQESQDFSAMPSITGYDNHKHAIYSSKENIRQAAMADYIHIEKRDIAEATPRKTDDKGIIVVNPPYGERIGKSEDVSKLYYTMGEQFKTAFPEWDAFVFTNSDELAKSIALRAYKTNALYNGPLQCTLLHFHVTPQWYFEAHDGFRYIHTDLRDASVEMFVNRLQKNLKHLKRWAKRENINCYRAYDADIPEYALAIDFYYTDELLIHAQEYEAPKSIEEKVARKRLNDALSALTDFLEIDKSKIHLKTRKQQKGVSQYQKQDKNSRTYIVDENGLKFAINLEKYLDTGIFLDHRKTRQLIFNMAQSKSFLNLFCYTGTVSVYAAAAGAKSTVSVDMSNTYLNWAKRNFTLNQFEGGQYEFVQADCVNWLEQNTQKFDLIFLDPPSFSNSKRMDKHFSVQNDHEFLINACMQCLNKGGTLIFSNNFRKFKMSPDIMQKYNVTNISGKTLPEDFKRNPKIHNCWEIRAL